jgi:hypothetical protein
VHVVQDTKERAVWRLRQSVLQVKPLLDFHEFGVVGFFFFFFTKVRGRNFVADANIGSANHFVLKGVIEFLSILYTLLERFVTFMNIHTVKLHSFLGGGNSKIFFFFFFYLFCLNVVKFFFNINCPQKFCWAILSFVKMCRMKATVLMGVN